MRIPQVRIFLERVCGQFNSYPQRKPVNMTFKFYHPDQIVLNGPCLNKCVLIPYHRTKCRSLIISPEHLVISVNPQ